MKVVKATLAIIMVAIFSVACATSGEPGANKNTASSAAPANANQQPAVTSAADSKPAETAPTAGTDVAKIFADKCVICHGADGKGVTKGTPDVTNAAWQSKETDAEFVEAIKKGKKPTMPAFENKLNDEEIKALVQYVRAFAKK